MLERIYFSMIVQQNNTISLSIIATISLVAFVLTAFSISFIPVSADPFGIFDYENPQVVKIQGLRAHLFETHDAAHKADASEIGMHMNMANEEITQFLRNLTAEGTTANQDSQELSKILQSVNMQFDELVTLAHNGNMTGVMTTLNSTDQQLANLVDNS